MILSRFAGPNWEADPAIAARLPLVDLHFDAASPQHPMRRWEYALALLALETWAERELWAKHRDPPRASLLLDVGGAGSPLSIILGAAHFRDVRVIDPELNCSIEKYRLPQFADAVFSISVLEHVEDPYGFLEACVRQVIPGGLLFLTVDAWDPPIDAAQDTAHFHWMRKRIFTKHTISKTMELLLAWGLQPFGGVDLEYKGNTVYDYTFASICMMKEWKKP